MPVNYEIKSQLAKLLATEDLVVEHKNIDTAQFNVHTRVLTLPMWEKASNQVYDMLVGHEVGHALYTPDEDPPRDVPHQFINVTEDARIEKLMKRKYAGLSKTFFRGYQELNDEDFFELGEQDVNSMNLADKANLYFKIGNFLDIDFNYQERQIIDTISAAETFDDAIDAARLLYDFCKEKQKQETQAISPPSPARDSISGESEDSEGSNESEDGADTERDDQTENSDHGDTDTLELDDPGVSTDDLLQSKIKDLVSDNPNRENIYLEVPKVNLDTVIISNKEIHEHIDLAYADHANQELCVSDSEYKKFKKSAQKEVNYLVKEFECRKAADSYARANTSRTGVLDTSKLHTYKYNEDLFKKVTTLSDGKNHGLVFVLDWSGSMSHVMKDTIKQLYNLIWFCKKVSIPFEVYAFTNEWNSCEWDDNGNRIIVDHYEVKENLLSIDPAFGMMNFLSSKTKDIESQMLNIWRLVDSLWGMYPYVMRTPKKMGLSGTPLNEALVTLHQILPQFQRENNVQKVQCIVLTDGEANYIPYHVKVQRPWEEHPYIGRNTLNDRCTIRDRKLGRTYRVPHTWNEFTDLMLRHLKDTFVNTNFIGIRVLESRNLGFFVRTYHDQYTDEYNEIMKDWKKLKSFTITNSGYDAYFGMSATALADNSEFEVDEGATKAKIKSAFIKSLKTKKLNKKVLGEFVSLVA